MALISLQNVSIAFGGQRLLDGQSLHIEKNQRICLLGRNGTGKTTLLKILRGELAPDNGIIHKEPGLRVSYFSQRLPQGVEGSVFDIIARGLGKRGELLIKHHQDEQRISFHSDADHHALAQLHAELDEHHSWAALDEIGKITSHMALQHDWAYATLSGGQKRRVLLAAALVSEPDVLLLDEPTNHLDIQTIAWMEEFLLRSGVTVLFVTHDRMFVKTLATRILELDRGRLFDWSCTYEMFLERKQGALEAQEKEWETFDKKLAQEEIWIRKGIKARRTRNEGRVKALMKMRAARKARRQREGTASLMKVVDAQMSGKIVIEARGVTYSYDDEPLIRDFSTLITRGDKVGVIGPNGSGKTTLMNLFMGNMTPQSGTIRRGTNLAITYFDQFREQIDEDKTVWENVLPVGDFVVIDGKQTHIITYLQNFLFTPDRAKTPVSQLSGGERNRLLLARLFTKPSNLLVLDEPTNDLDAETLELLEELLVNFQGTVLLICHDRMFLNNVVTSTLVFSGHGKVEEYVGGYDDWIAQRPPEMPQTKSSGTNNKKNQYKEERKAKQKKKLSFSEMREIKELPAQIESLEEEQAALHTQMGDPGFYRCPPEQIAAATTRLKELEEEISTAYARWELLESIESAL
jgi:ATP-binding cassette subfamily F protein uup